MQSVGQQSFESASQWIAAAKLGPEELQNFADGLNNSTTTGTQWAMTLPPGKDRDETLKNIQDNSPAK